jgi:hypothetical protein
MKQMCFEQFFAESTDPEAHEELKTFLEKRKAGAAKIAKQATIKGGYSSLTADHFKAKAKPYEDCIKHLGDKKAVKEHIKFLLQKLKSWDKMTQKEFQKVMGELEVYGEVAIQIMHPKNYD